MKAVTIADWSIPYYSGIVCPLLTPDITDLDRLFCWRAHL